MKITIYTITDCQFSKQEKEYLSSHGAVFEEKNLETNREYLTEMLAVGSNFAGTPVTKIDKDDGQTVVLKGFTPAEFDKVLGFEHGAAPVVEVVPEVAPQQVAIAPEPAVLPPVDTVPVVAPPVEVAPPVPQEAPAPVQATPASDPAFASILSSLEQQAQAPVSTPPPVSEAPQEPVAPPVSGQPVIPDPQF